MKKLIAVFMIGLTLSLTMVPAYEAHAQIPIVDIIKAGIKKVIKAIDLKIQRLQNRTQVLQNAQKALENSMSKLKLKEIGDWAQKQKDLYQTYYDDLKKVRTTIAYYQRIKEIALKQVQLVAEYKRDYGLLRNDGHFTPAELDYMSKVYSGIMDESVKNLDQVKLAVSSFQTQMSDAKRLEIIDHAADRIEINYSDLKEFGNQNMALSIQRSRTQNEINTMRAYYGIK